MTITQIQILLLLLLNFSISYLLLEKYFIDQFHELKSVKVLSLQLLHIGNIVSVGLFGIPMYIAIQTRVNAVILFVRLVAVSVSFPLFLSFFVARRFEESRHFE